MAKKKSIRVDFVKSCIIYDTASYARVYQHDVRAKQTKVCDAERAGFHTPTHASNYLQTDGQLKLAAVFSARR